MTNQKSIHVVIVNDYVVDRSALRLLLHAENDISVVGDGGDVRAGVFQAREIESIEGARTIVAAEVSFR